MNLRMLISLFVVLAMLPLAVSSFESISRLEYRHEEISDEIAMYKLRRIYLLSYERNISDEGIGFVYQGKEFELGLKNGKLILSPGTQIFLDNIDYAWFIKEDGLIKIIYARKGKRYEKILGKKEGLHFDDFLSDDDLSAFADEFNDVSDEDVS